MALLLITGCATKAPNADFPKPQEATRVELQPGDEIQIKFVMTPELDDTQIIRPDGKISLPYLQDVAAAGLSPSELQQTLTSSYADQLKSPQVVVIVRNLAQQRIYVGGRVRTPGLYPLLGRLSALEAVMQAGGFDEQYAKRSSVVVVRYKDGVTYSQLLNLNKTLEEDKVTPFLLQPGDILYVPETAISKVDRWVDQYLNQVIPSNAFFAAQTINDLKNNNNNTNRTVIPSGVSTFSNVPATPTPATTAR